MRASVARPEVRQRVAEEQRTAHRAAPSSDTRSRLTSSPGETSGEAAQRRLQEAADDSPRVRQLMQLEAVANRGREPAADRAGADSVVQRLQIRRGDENLWRKAGSDEGGEETNDMGFPDFMKLLDELIRVGDYSLINDILMDMPLDRLGIFYNSVQRAHADETDQRYQLIRIFYSNRRPSNVRLTLTEEAEEMLRPPPEEVDVSRLTEVEPWHEDALGNMRQGMTETTKTKRLERQDREDEERETPITLGEDMIDFMGDQTPLSQHLREIRKIILDGGFLVRRMSEAESMPYEMSDFALDPENVFMKGKENMKAFRVDEEYSFKDKTRDKDADKYAIIVKVFLTPKLKQYFINYLFANVKNLLGVTFSFNPQFKYEQGGVTILIPKSGWGEFWSFVAGDYSIESAGGEKGGDGPSFEEVSDEKEKDQKKSEETQELDIDEEIADVETFDPSSLLSGESLETVWTEDALGKTFEGADGKSYQLIERTMGGKFLFKRL